MSIEWAFYCCCTFYLPRKLGQIVPCAPFPAKLGSAYLDHGPALWELASPVKAWCPGAYPTPWDSHTPMISNMLLAVLATHRIFRDLYIIFFYLSCFVVKYNLSFSLQKLKHVLKFKSSNVWIVPNSTKIFLCIQFLSGWEDLAAGETENTFIAYLWICSKYEKYCR